MNHHHHHHRTAFFRCHSAALPLRLLQTKYKWGKREGLKFQEVSCSSGYSLWWSMFCCLLGVHDLRFLWFMCSFTFLCPQCFLLGHPCSCQAHSHLIPVASLPGVCHCVTLFIVYVFLLASQSPIKCVHATLSFLVHLFPKFIFSCKFLATVTVFCFL